jgi:hypothetical protein
MIEQRIATPVQVTPMHLDAFLNFRPCLEMFDAVLDFEIRGNGQRRTNDVHVKRNTCVAWCRTVLKSALTQFWCSVYGSLNSGSEVGERGAILYRHAHTFAALAF